MQAVTWGLGVGVGGKWGACPVYVCVQRMCQCMGCGAQLCAPTDVRVAVPIACIHVGSQVSAHRCLRGCVCSGWSCVSSGMWLCVDLGAQVCDPPRLVTRAACMGQSRSHSWDQRAGGGGVGVDAGRRWGRSPVAPSRHAGLPRPACWERRPPAPGPRLVPSPGAGPWTEGAGGPRQVLGGRGDLARAVSRASPRHFPGFLGAGPGAGGSLPPHLAAGPGSLRGAGGRWAEALALSRPAAAARAARLPQAVFAPPGGAYIRHKLFPGLMFDFLGGLSATQRGECCGPAGPSVLKGGLGRAADRAGSLAGTRAGPGRLTGGPGPSGSCRSEGSALGPAREPCPCPRADSVLRPRVPCRGLWTRGPETWPPGKGEHAQRNVHRHRPPRARSCHPRGPRGSQGSPV